MSNRIRDRNLIVIGACTNTLPLSLVDYYLIAYFLVWSGLDLRSPVTLKM